MTIIVRCIFYRTATPSCDILCLSFDEWRAFFAATPTNRMHIALTKLHKTYLLGATKEMVWIPYDYQNKVRIIGEEE